MDLTRFPREYFAHLPTPIDPMKNLSKLLGGPDIWIKRDDCTGLSTGGSAALFGYLDEFRTGSPG